MKRFGEMTSKEALNSKIHRLWKHAHRHPKVVDVTEHKAGSLFQTGCSSPPSRAGQGSVRGGGKLVSWASVFTLPRSRKGGGDGSCPYSPVPGGIKFII